MKLRLFIVCLALSVAGFTSLPLYADSTIFVANPGFETFNPLTTNCGVGCDYNSGPIPSWTGNGGSWRPNSTYFNLPVPDPSLIAYTNGGTISQDTGVSLLPNSTYTLSVFVGNRKDGLSGAYSIALDAGGVMLASLPGLSSAIPSGTFADEILHFSTGSFVPSGNLSIDLASLDAGQADFDKVSLTVGNTVVPEPASLILLVTGGAFLGLLSLRRRK